MVETASGEPERTRVAHSGAIALAPRQIVKSSTDVPANVTAVSDFRGDVEALKAGFNLGRRASRSITPSYLFQVSAPASFCRTGEQWGGRTPSLGLSDAYAQILPIATS